MKLRPKNWERFQHYRDRLPTWIKLHRDTLADADFMAMPHGHRGIAMMMWLLASEGDDGEFKADIATLEWRLRIPRKELQPAVEALVRSGWFVCSEPLATPEAASTPLAAPEHSGSDLGQSLSLSLSLLSSSLSEKKATVVPDGFEEFWKAYRKAVGRKDAIRAWVKLAPDAELVAVIVKQAAAYAASVDEIKFQKHPATWLRANGWEDEIAPRTAKRTLGQHQFSDIDYGQTGAL